MTKTTTVHLDKEGNSVDAQNVDAIASVMCEVEVPIKVRDIKGWGKLVIEGVKFLMKLRILAIKEGVEVQNNVNIFVGPREHILFLDGGASFTLVPTARVVFGSDSDDD